MDWKQFVAEITDTLAWPSVAALALALFRKDIKSLIDRTEYAKFLGNELSLRKTIQDNTAKADALEPSTNVESEPEAAFIRDLTPSESVLAAFEPIEVVLTQFRGLLDIKRQANLEAIMLQLVRRGWVDPITADLFHGLYEVRTAARKGRANNLTLADVREFWRQATILQGTLSKIYEAKKESPTP